MVFKCSQIYCHLFFNFVGMTQADFRLAKHYLLLLIWIAEQDSTIYWLWLLKPGHHFVTIRYWFLKIIILKKKLGFHFGFLVFLLNCSYKINA